MLVQILTCTHIPTDTHTTDRSKHTYTLPGIYSQTQMCLDLKALTLSSSDSSLSVPSPPIKPKAKKHCAVWVFHAKHFIETNNSRGRDKLRGVIGKRENICFQLQFKMKCSVDETENTAGRPFRQKKRPRRAPVNLAYSLRPVTLGRWDSDILLPLARPLTADPPLMFKYPWHVNFFQLRIKDSSG